MRKIKFRAWDKEKKEWYKPVHEAYAGKLWELFIGFSGELCAHRIGGMEHQSNWPNRYELMQFTGLLDKNGKEIWEGDIVSYPNPSCKGDIKLGSYSFSDYDVQENGTGFYIDRSDSHVEGLTDTDCIEVIGNIYENPELTK